MDINAGEAAVLVTVMMPSLAALVWVGRVAQKVDRAERDDQTASVKLHELRNNLTPVIANLQIAVARLEGFYEGWQARGRREELASTDE